MTQVISSTAELAAAAADAVARRIGAPDDAVVVVTRDAPAGDGPGTAIVAAVQGARSGELTVVLYDSAVGASGESVRSLAQRLHGEVAADVGMRADTTVQVVDPRLAVNALLADPSSTVAVLSARGTVLATVGLRLSEPSAGSPGTTPNPRLDPTRLHLLRGVEMAVTAEIGRTRMTVGELLTLAEGSVIELDRPAGAPADLLVNGRLIARGEIVVIDENFALRITDIVSADEER